MLSRSVTVGVDDGLHARPVAELVRLAQQHDGEATLSTASGHTASLSSVLAVMELAIAAGDQVRIEVTDSPGGDRLLDAVVAVLEGA